VSAAKVIPHEHLEIARAVSEGRYGDAISILQPLAVTSNDGARFAPAILAPEDWPDVEPPVRWMFPSLRIAAGRPSIFNGAGSIGKSLVAQYVATCALGGVTGLGGLIEPGPCRRVVHIDGDQGVTVSRKRYRRLAASVGVQQRPWLVSLVKAMEHGFSARRAADWRELIDGFDLAIVDSFSSIVSVSGLDENSATDCKAVLTALLEASDATQCAVIMISHTGHDSDDGKGNTAQRKRPRGSSAIIQGAGSIWTFTGGTKRGDVRTASLERESEQDDGNEHVNAWQFSIVARHDRSTGMLDEHGRPVPALDVQRVEGGASTVDRELEREADVARKIIDTLAREKEYTRRDDVLRAARAGNLEFARGVLTRLIGRRVVVQHEGKYRLASDV